MALRIYGLFAAAVAFLIAYLTHSSWRIWPERCCKTPASNLSAGQGAISHGKGERLNRGCPDTSGLAAIESLDRHGFAVIPQFLPPEDNAFLLATFKELRFLSSDDPTQNAGQSKGYKHFRKPPTELLTPKALELIKNMNDEIEHGIGYDIQAASWDQQGFHNEFTYTNSSDPEESMMTGWHQDKGGYFGGGSEGVAVDDGIAKYIIYYFVLAKPDPDEAGLDVVSMERLKTVCPTCYNAFFGKGYWGTAGVLDAEAERFGAKEIVVDYQHDRIMHLNFTLEDIMCTPTLLPGDVIVMRMDTLHRTSRHESARLSWGFRLWKKGNPSDFKDLIPEGGIFRSGYFQYDCSTWPQEFWLTCMRLKSYRAWKFSLLLPIRLISGMLVGESPMFGYASAMYMLGAHS